MRFSESEVLRYGVILGLTLVIIGLILTHIMSLWSGIITLGLLVIILTPLATLTLITFKLIGERRFLEFILAVLTLAIIITSIIVSLYLRML